MDVGAAKNLAEELLAEDLPRRWAHTQGVARQARSLSARLGEDGPLVEAAAWLHDIGYAPPLATTGFHPLDGARYLRDVVHAGSVICELVAYHSGAEVEAEERVLKSELMHEFPLGSAASTLLEVLTACDMTTSPTGEVVDVQERVAEIQERYQPEDPVYRAVTRSGSALESAAKRYFGN